MDLLTVKDLENVEHRAVLVVKEPLRDANLVVGRDANKPLIERTMVDRAEAETVAHGRLAELLDVADDVGRV